MLSFFHRSRSAPGKLFTAPAGDHAPWQSEQRGELAALPRMLVHVIPRQPFVDWARQQDADKSLAGMRRTESLAYLIPTESWETREAPTRNSAATLCSSRSQRCRVRFIFNKPIS